MRSCGCGRSASSRRALLAVPDLGVALGRSRRCEALPWTSFARLELSPQQESAKQHAITAHVSQHSPLSDRAGDEAILGPDMVAHFQRPFETFVVAGAHDASTGAYFDRLYADADDPWGLGTRFYEQRKRSLLLASLPRPRFDSAFEPGCATGLLTAELGDTVQRRPCVGCRTTGRRRDVAARRGPAERRRGTRRDSRRVARRPVRPHRAVRGGVLQPRPRPARRTCVDEPLRRRRARRLSLAACSARSPAPADDVHAALDRAPLRVVRHVEDDFRLDVWSTAGRSVAAQTGLLA